MGDIGSLGRVGWKTLAYTVLVSGIGVVIALTLVNLLRPGDGIDPEFARTMLASAGDGAKAIVSTSREAPTGLDALLNIVPTNIIGAAGSKDILAVMFFALLFGIGPVMVDMPENRTMESDRKSTRLNSSH